MTKAKVEALAKRLGVGVDDDGSTSIYVDAPKGKVWASLRHYRIIGTYGFGDAPKSEAWESVYDDMLTGLEDSTPEEEAEREWEEAEAEKKLKEILDKPQERRLD